MDTQASGKDKRPLPELFRETWGQALAAVSSAEEEAHKALSRVSELSGWSQDEVRRHAREFAERLAGQRREIEQSMDSGVRRALSRVKLPRREEVEALQARAAALEAQVEGLLHGRVSR